MDTARALEIAAKLRVAYDRCKDMPEYSDSGRIALIDLRNLAPDAADAIEALARQEPG